MSETVAAQPTTELTPTAAQAEPDSTDWKAEARKWEDRSKSNAQAAKELREVQARLAQFEDANKSETDRLNDRAAKAETDAQTWRGRYLDLAKRQAIIEAASGANSTDAETVYLYLQSEVEVDDDGNVQGLDKALSALHTRKPHLFRTTPAGARDATATGTPPALNSDALTDALRRAVGA